MTSGARAVMFAMPEHTVIASVAPASSDRCAKMSRELEPSGTHSARKPSDSSPRASMPICSTEWESNANVQTPTSPSADRSAS